MGKTTFDLDALTLTLDYRELKAVASIAVKYSLEELERRLRKWHDWSNSQPIPRIDAVWMRECAEDLERATTTLYYLQHGEDREIREFSEPERRREITHDRRRNGKKVAA